MCSFDDEFDATTLDRTQWTPQLTSNSNFTTGLPPYRACYLDNPKTISESGGYLRLSVVRTKTFQCAAPKRLGLSLYDFPTRYEAGEVTTYYGFHQTFGRFEVRARMPNATVDGLQETLWLWPTDDTKYGGGEPASGEIDFAEFYSRYSDRVIPYLHYDYNPSTVSKKTDTNIVTNDYTCLVDTTRFHRYVAIWKPGRITLKYDGKTCLVDNYRPSDVASPAPFDQPFFLALTQALGTTGNRPTAATPLPATMLIDYVRVWK